MGPGGLAQLGEHLLCKQGVVGSIPSSSTIKRYLNVKKLNTKAASMLGNESGGFFVVDQDLLVNRLFFKNS